MDEDSDIYNIVFYMYSKIVDYISNGISKDELVIMMPPFVWNEVINFKMDRIIDTEDFTQNREFFGVDVELVKDIDTLKVTTKSSFKLELEKGIEKCVMNIRK